MDGGRTPAQRPNTPYLPFNPYQGPISRIYQGPTGRGSFDPNRQGGLSAYNVAYSQYRQFAERQKSALDAQRAKQATSPVYSTAYSEVRQFAERQKSALDVHNAKFVQYRKDMEDRMRTFQDAQRGARR